MHAAQLALLYGYGAAALAYLVVIQNSYPVESYFRVLPYGSVAFSLRYASFQWALTLLATFKLLMFPVMCTALLYRRKRECVTAWTVVVILLACVDLVTVIGLGRFYGACNESGQVDNPCNDRRWCCHASIYSVTSNLCPRSTPCTPPVTRLDPDADFLWAFYLSLLFALLDGALIFSFAALPNREEPRPSEDIGGDDEEEQPAKQRAPPQSAGSIVAAVLQQPIAKWTKGE